MLNGQGVWVYPVIAVIIIAVFAVMFFLKSGAKGGSSGSLVETDELMESREEIVQNTMKKLLKEDIEFIETDHDKGIFVIKAGDNIYNVKYNKKDEVVDFITRKNEVVLDGSPS